MSRDENKLWLPDNTEYYPKAEEERLSVSEEQMIAAKKLEDESPYFHCESKGCEMEDLEESSKNYLSNLKFKYCKTHDKKCCRCGWEIFFHYGTSSKRLSKVEKWRPVEK